MTKCFVGSVFVLTACASGAPRSEGVADDVPPSTVERHGRPPVLSGHPLWAVDDPRPDPDLCFGVAVAAGDLDGDGHRDVIVASEVCAADSPAQGRVTIYRGGRSLPSTTPVVTELDWQNPSRVASQLKLAVGDVDGDGRDDLLVSSQAGAMVFTGITNLAVPFGAPSFRVPGTGTFGPAVLADVDGDHRADLVSVRARVATVWLSTPGAGAPFTAARTVTPATAVVAAGDANGDGIADLVVTNRVDSQLLLGCRAGEPDCSGGLRTAPAWTTKGQPVSGLVPDINHDGLREALVTDTGFLGSVGSGRAWLYLSDAAAGGLSATPAWATLGDPHYPGFGPGVVVPGDLDGDGQATEFVVPSGGRVYAFFPPHHDLADMRAGFAWPREDGTQDQLDAGELRLGGGVAIAAAGDVNRDGFADLLIGAPPDLVTLIGRVYLVGGGRRVPRGGPPPFLPGAPVCTFPATGTPDLTVDAPALERSMFVERRTFAPDACEIAEGCVGGSGERRLLRFATSIANFGGAPAIIPSVDTAPELYHLSACDGQPELADFARYELTDRTGSHIAAGGKQSVFILDVAPNCINAPPASLFLPDAGLSPGWGDVYVASTPCNWLDVTDVPDGRYTLHVAIDTHHIIDQGDQDNVLPDTAAIDLELRGNTVKLRH